MAVLVKERRVLRRRVVRRAFRRDRTRLLLMSSLSCPGQEKVSGERRHGTFV